GINMNIGPMLHADKKDAYSYSEEVDIVGKQGRAAIEGYHAAQVLAVADSFPTNLEVLHSDAPIYKTALHPFQYVIEDGVQAIATEDAATTADILRGKLDFQGLIIQDYTETTAAYDQVINHIRAEANMIVLNDTYRAQMNIMNIVMDAVKTDVITESTLDTALERVYAVKESFTIKDVVPFNRDLYNNKKSMSFMKQMEKKLEQATITT